MSKPRSRRVGIAGPPSELKLSPMVYDSSSSPPPSPPSPIAASPPVPARSPLRPPTRLILDASTMPGTSGTFSRPQGFVRPNTPPPLDIEDFAGIADAVIPLEFQMRNRSFPSMNGIHDSIGSHSEDGLMSKALPMPPSSPMSITLMDDEAASSSSSLAHQPAMTKRQHALHELLSSERAYASDLALIREVHIPLALGHTVPIHAAPVSPPLSSSSSSRTLSTASDSSIASLGPPMTLEDTKIIFSNIAELALFSDMFCEGLQEALGEVVDGGEGEDRVGALFLQIIPDLERPYKHYITRHPTALQHLQSLPSTPALTAYLAYTQNVASSLSHAWDLSSLLIKPVQRLLKYPLLLAAIIDETPDAHGDKESLKLARQRMEEVARNVNEGRRRAEVVKEVLTSKKKPVNVGVAASVNLSKMKSLRHGKSPAQLADRNGEAALVEQMHTELKRIDHFAQMFAKNVIEWSKTMGNMVVALRVWAISFGKVIGLSEENESESFEAFVTVVEKHLMPLCIELEAVITERLLKEIAHLLTTMIQPLKLLASMNEQEPFHYHLLMMNLPQYLGLLHKGLATFVRRLATIQTQFWADVRERWSELWDMLRVEGELNAGHTETVNVWRARWMDMEGAIAALNIVQRKKLYQDPPRPAPNSDLKRSTTSSMHSMMSSLEPVHNAGPSVSSPYPLTPSRGRARGASDASNPKGRVPRRTSNESLRSGKPKPKSPRRRTEDMGEYVAVISGPNAPIPQVPMIPRTKSMPLPHKTVTPRTSTSSSKTNGGGGDDAPPQYQEAQDDRGRTARKQSLRKKFQDSLRPSSTSQHRTSSTKSMASPTTSFFTPDRDAPPNPPNLPYNSQTRRDSWENKNAKYICQVVHACKPPAAVSYFSFPFFTLIEDDLYEVLQEAGHPSLHPKLPLYVDDGEDCLLLCRDQNRNVGWALASFLAPIGSTE
ncbi:hypothetical protein BD779DRAFT_1531904 [Infundibulicybe gibba]|nr:hypothetical protein BD779DRAFT_1531904 [Infundibulicybe gibba]